MMKFFGNFIEEKADSHLHDDSLYMNRFMESGAPVLKTIDDIIDRDARINIEGRKFVFTREIVFCFAVVEKKFSIIKVFDPSVVRTNADLITFFNFTIVKIS